MLNFRSALLLSLFLPIAAETLAAKSTSPPSPQKIPLSAWVHDPVIDSVELNFSGTHLAALTLPAIDHVPQITVWQTKDLSRSPIRFSPPCQPGCVKPLSLGWLNDEYLYVVGRQKLDIKAGARTIKTFSDSLFVFRRDGKKHYEFFRSKDGSQSFSIVNKLRHDPSKILVKLVENSSEEFHELDLKNMRARRVFRGAKNKWYILDPLGNIVGYQDLAGAGDEVHIQTWLKNPDKDKFEHHFTRYAKQRSGVEEVLFAGEGQVFIKDSKTRDHDVLRTYDIATRDTGKISHSHSQFDIGELLLSPFPGEAKKIIGHTVSGPRKEYVYTDPRYASLQKKLVSLLGEELQHQITSVSDGFGLAVIFTHGPTDPGRYYLLVGGKSLVRLGARYPQLDPELLAPMKFLHYKARDGLRIPAFLTVPKHGEPPYPAVIMPHGGPWARDRLDWDLWAQFLANRGYVVLQPQYRGSEGFGNALWIAGDRQWGKKMQDDKDDGAKWLVSEKFASQNRLAMFGYSYGGYAAMVAAIRKDTPYQCAIAGAGLSELRTFDKITSENPFVRYYQNPTVAGLSPLDHVKDARIPLLLLHGDRDLRVPAEQSEKFYEALKSEGKQVEYIEIPDLWHSMPWWPQHHYAVLENLERFLEEDCGPGGL